MSKVDPLCAQAIIQKGTCKNAPCSPQKKKRLPRKVKTIVEN